MNRGPSAGTAILTSLVSLFAKQGIPSDIALTGEITLAGSVLAVGGLKVKVLTLADRSLISDLFLWSKCSGKNPCCAPSRYEEDSPTSCMSSRCER